MRIRKSLIALVAAIIISIILPIRVFGGPESPPLPLGLYFWDFDDKGQEYMCFEPFYEDLSGLLAEEAANKVFDLLLNENLGFPFIPKGTKLLGLRVSENEIFLNFSKSINNHGGCAYELAMVEQLAANAAQLPGVEFMTILIEGGETYLTEGLDVEKWPLTPVFSADL